MDNKTKTLIINDLNYVDIIFNNKPQSCVACKRQFLKYELRIYKSCGKTFSDLCVECANYMWEMNFK